MGFSGERKPSLIYRGETDCFAVCGDRRTGERVPVGGRSPVENSAVASDIAERAPLGHSNRSDPFSFVNSVVAEPAGENGGRDSHTQKGG